MSCCTECRSYPRVPCCQQVTAMGWQLWQTHWWWHAHSTSPLPCLLFVLPAAVLDPFFLQGSPGDSAFWKQLPEGLASMSQPSRCALPPENQRYKDGLKEGTKAFETTAAWTSASNSHGRALKNAQLALRFTRQQIQKNQRPRSGGWDACSPAFL